MDYLLYEVETTHHNLMRGYRSTLEKFARFLHEANKP